MDAILTRTVDLPASALPSRPAENTAKGIAGMLRRLLSGMAYAAAERLTSPQRDVPPEWFRYPLP